MWTVVCYLAWLVTFASCRALVSFLFSFFKQSNVVLYNICMLHYILQGNAIYNILPDIISRLSDPKSSVDEKPFRQIMK